MDSNDLINQIGLFEGLKSGVLKAGVNVAETGTAKPEAQATLAAEEKNK